MTSLHVAGQGRDGQGTAGRHVREGGAVRPAGRRSWPTRRSTAAKPVDADAVRRPHAASPGAGGQQALSPRLAARRARPADVPVGRRPDAEGVRRRRRTWRSRSRCKTEVGYLKLGDLEVAVIPGEIYPELVLGKVQDPADPGADFPDAPVEPAIYAQMKGKHRMIDRPGERRDRLHHPEAAVGREAAVLLRAEEGPVRRGEQRRPGRGAGDLCGAFKELVAGEVTADEAESTMCLRRGAAADGSQGREPLDSGSLKQSSPGGAADSAAPPGLKSFRSSAFPRPGARAPGYRPPPLRGEDRRRNRVARGVMSRHLRQDRAFAVAQRDLCSPPPERCRRRSPAVLAAELVRRRGVVGGRAAHPAARTTAACTAPGRCRSRGRTPCTSAPRSPGRRRWRTAASPRSAGRRSPSRPATSAASTTTTGSYPP